MSAFIRIFRWSPAFLILLTTAVCGSGVHPTPIPPFSTKMISHHPCFCSTDRSDSGKNKSAAYVRRSTSLPAFLCSSSQPSAFETGMLYTFAISQTVSPSADLECSAVLSPRLASPSARQSTLISSVRPGNSGPLASSFTAVHSYPVSSKSSRLTASKTVSAANSGESPIRPAGSSTTVTH